MLNARQNNEQVNIAMQVAGAEIERWDQDTKDAILAAGGVFNLSFGRFDTQINQEAFMVFLNIEKPPFPHEGTQNTPFIKKGTDVVTLLNETKNDFLKQLHCKHDFVRIRDNNGTEITTGDAKCTHCDILVDNYLPKGEPQRSFPDHSSSSSKLRVIALKNWPTKNCAMQGAHSESGESFFEAFPTIDGVPTYIRGEGKLIADAEVDAYEQFIKQSKCKSHDWSRTVNNTLRSDGYAICTKCGLTGMALEPVTTCVKCNRPTNNLVGDKYLCETHAFEMTEHEYLQSTLLATNDEISKLFRADPAHTRLLFRVKKHAFLKACKGDIELFQSFRHEILQFCMAIENACKKTLTENQNDPFRDLTESELDSRTIDTIIKKHLIALPAILWDVQQKRESEG
jgi:hypothetical protein